MAQGKKRDRAFPVNDKHKDSIPSVPPGLSVEAEDLWEYIWSYSAQFDNALNHLDYIKIVDICRTYQSYYRLWVKLETGLIPLVITGGNGIRYKSPEAKECDDLHKKWTEDIDNLGIFSFTKRQKLVLSDGDNPEPTEDVQKERERDLAARKAKAGDR